MSDFSPEQIDKLFHWTMDEMGYRNCTEGMDNKELLWRLMTSEAWSNLPFSGPQAALFEEMGRRLFPEYDGDQIALQEYGWLTPEGEIRYP